MSEPTETEIARCGRCGHEVTLHGRRGFGHCRHGWESPLARAVAILKEAVLQNATEDEQKTAVAEAMDPKARCACRRFLKNAPTVREGDKL